MSETPPDERWGLDSLNPLVDLGDAFVAQFTPGSLGILDLFLYTFLQPLHLVKRLLTVGLEASLLSSQRVHLGLDLTPPVVSGWSLRQLDSSPDSVLYVSSIRSHEGLRFLSSSPAWT